MCRHAIGNTRSLEPKVNTQFEQVISHLHGANRAPEPTTAGERTGADTNVVLEPAMQTTAQGEKRKRVEVSKTMTLLIYMSTRSNILAYMKVEEPQMPATLSIMQRIARLESAILGEVKEGAIVPRLKELERNVGEACDLPTPLKRIEALEANFL